MARNVLLPLVQCLGPSLAKRVELSHWLPGFRRKKLPRWVASRGRQMNCLCHWGGFGGLSVFERTRSLGKRGPVTLLASWKVDDVDVVMWFDNMKWYDRLDDIGSMSWGLWLWDLHRLAYIKATHFHPFLQRLILVGFVSCRLSYFLALSYARPVSVT